MIHADLLAAIRKNGGRATLGDLITLTALPAGDIEQAILPALSRVGGHVAVDANGELIYAVDRTRAVPPDTSRLARFGRAVYTVFQAVFYAALSVVLVAYFIFYVVLLVALAVMAIAGAARGGDSDCDCDCDCKGCDGCDGCGGCGDCAGGSANGCGDSCFACFTCGSPPKRARRAELRERQQVTRNARRVARAERRASRSRRRREAIRLLGLGERFAKADLGLALAPAPTPAKLPFTRAVHAFIFGPPRPPEDPRRRERNLLAFVQAHDGRATAADAVSLTGLPIDQADALLLSLAAQYEGDVRVTDGGVIVYTFDRLLVSASEDTEVLDWVVGRGGAVTVEDLARRLGLTAASARARLTHLAAVAGGAIEHGATTRAVFPADARARLVDLASRSDAPREFTYAWERLEVAPWVVGVPAGERGWIYAFNGLNLALSLILSTLYGDGELALVDLFFDGGSPAWEPWVIGYVPLMFSLSVFAIPLVRAVAAAIANRGRRLRNQRRAVLLGIFHALEEEDDRVSTPELITVLGMDAAPSGRARLEEVLRSLAAELDGELDLSGPAEAGGARVYRFPRVHRELHAIERERLAVDRGALGLGEVIYDTAQPFDPDAGA
ncbi:MAG: hypothetical protein CVU56_24505 [Deltaproteobacteria bacterium HGW-Deltaproteobacteria-14]|jgi:hypothetical protein|nr:MAG: hypothetical protein CVU56_24505 [Deltaproteobacteria bacterium HGW-Deltaproteobacteria-14]